MAETSIEWTDKTWGPVVGCTHKSPGCLHCYAETMAGRQVLMSAAQGRRSVYLRVIQPGTRKWSRPADVRRDPEHHRHVELLPERLAQPLRWRAGTRVFVCSMSDLFHEDVPFDYIAQVFGVMAATPGVTYQVLTKRPERMREFFEHRFGLEGIEDTVFREAMEHRGVIWDGRAPRMGWPRGARPIHYAHLYPQAPDPKTLHRRLPWVWPLPNVWLGTSVEDQQRADERIPHLLAAPAAVRFLSVEPLLGPVDLGLGRWVRLAATVRADRFPGIRLPGDELAVEPGIYKAESNPLGALSIRTPDGALGIKPAEFERLRLDWVIVGGESGPKSRPMGEVLASLLDPLPGGDLVRSLRDQCGAAGVAFFFKQWGGVRKKKNGRLLDGREHNAMPEVHRGC